jgi:TRAP-type C4-dicarboxylate transport system substrate-binding protein
MRQITCAILSAATLLSLNVKAHAEELKFAIFAPPSGLVVKHIAEPWAEWAKKESNGAIDIKIYAGGTLGKNPAQQLKLVQDGVADIAWIVPSYTPSRFPSMSLFELPGVVKNANEGSAAMLSLYKQGKLPGFEDVKLVGGFTTDIYELHFAKPIGGINDLKGLKIRSGGPVQNDIIGALGAVPVGMPVTQIVEGMSRNVINGAILNWTSLVPFKVEETAKFHWKVDLGVTPLAFVMNKDVYERLSPAAKATIDKSPAMLAKLGGEAFEKMHATFEAKFSKDPKHKVAEPSAADRAEIEKRLNSVVSKASGSDKEGAALADLRDALKTVRQK